MVSIIFKYFNWFGLVSFELRNYSKEKLEYLEILESFKVIVIEVIHFIKIK